MTAGARTPPVRVNELRALSILLAFTSAVGLVRDTGMELLIKRNHGVVSGACLDHRAPAFAMAQEGHR